MAIEALLLTNFPDSVCTNGKTEKSWPRLFCRWKIVWSARDGNRIGSGDGDIALGLRYANASSIREERARSVVRKDSNVNRSGNGVAWTKTAFGDKKGRADYIYGFIFTVDYSTAFTVTVSREKENKNVACN